MTYCNVKLKNTRKKSGLAKEDIINKLKLSHLLNCGVESDLAHEIVNTCFDAFILEARKLQEDFDNQIIFLFPSDPIAYIINKLKGRGYFKKYNFSNTNKEN